MLTGDNAVREAESGCPWCRRIIVHEDGTETVIEPYDDSGDER